VNVVVLQVALARRFSGCSLLTTPCLTTNGSNSSRKRSSSSGAMLRWQVAAWKQQQQQQQREQETKRQRRRLLCVLPLQLCLRLLASLYRLHQSRRSTLGVVLVLFRHSLKRLLLSSSSRESSRHPGCLPCSWSPAQLSSTGWTLPAMWAALSPSGAAVAAAS
jgi:hypothetical protein